VEWLGDVPEPWQVRRIHQVTDPNRPVMYGIILPGPNVDQGVLIIKGGDCESSRLRPEFLSRTTVEIESRHARSRLIAHDIVFAIRGGVGAAELLPPELTGANLTQDAARISAGLHINSRWLLHALRAPILQEHVRARVVGATVRGINIRDLKRIELLVPPPEEQDRIVRFLDAATTAIEAAMERGHRGISLLSEYRNRLIADVVTGKLDVREAAAQLSDEAEETEALDEVESILDEDDQAIDNPDLEEVALEAGA
jgi:type I restriction enzyme, S subunit